MNRRYEMNKFYVIFNRSFIFNDRTATRYIRVATGPYTFKDACRYRELENRDNPYADAVIANIIIDIDGKVVK